MRLSVVAAAILAAAQPFVMTPWRLARWNARVSRAVVVDTSRSVVAADVAARLADQAMLDAFAARRLDAPDLADAIDRAVRWLDAAPPSRREIVVISDFQRGTVEERTLAAVPPNVGVRLIRAGILPETRRVTAPPMAGWRGGIWQASATIDRAGTRASWTRSGSVEGPPAWISIAAGAGDGPAADRALRAALSLGVASGDDGHRVLVRFSGAPALAPSAQPVRSAWVAASALAIRHSDLLAGVQPPAASERDGVMVVDAPIAAADLAAPAVVRAAILAVRPAAIIDIEDETASWPDADLARWRREPAPVTDSAIPTADDTQSRWLWGLAVLLLALETYVRQRRGRGPAVVEDREAHADAA